MTRISKTKMDHWIVSGDWKSLEKKAAEIVSNAGESAKSGRTDPLLGGGTRLMLELNHRISMILICSSAIRNGSGSCLQG